MRGRRSTSYTPTSTKGRHAHGREQYVNLLYNIIRNKSTRHQADAQLRQLIPTQPRARQLEWYRLVAAARESQG